MNKIKPRKAAKPENVIYPPYTCFCCCDTGLVSAPNPIYNDFFDGEIEIPMICTRPNCEAGRKYFHAWHREERGEEYIPAHKYRSMFDACLPASIAEEIHQRAYQLWRQNISANLATRAKKAAVMAKQVIEGVTF